MTLASHLSALETAGLLTVARTEPELEYLFRHTLIQDVAYESLLKSERSQLHRLAGEVLETAYPDRLDELSPRLAEHYSQAGETRKAFQYLLQAAESAARRYANAEAIGHYTRALEIAAGRPDDRRKVLQARGSLFEAIGSFGHSRADLEAALVLARESGDLKAEWELQLELGLLWAARDYRRTGKYYRQALKLARQSGDDRNLAHSLNRLGNYAINVDRPQLSLHHHMEALSVFFRLGDETGMAETLDMLGMASAMGGDMVQARVYLERAIETFDKVGDRRGMATAINTLGVTSLTHQAETMVTSSLTVEEGIHLAEKALQIAGSIGWRAGEVFAYCVLTLGLAGHGEYVRALESAERGLKIAKQIQHLQWEIFLRMGMGVIYLDLLKFDQAQVPLERGVALARKTNSRHWIGMLSGTLAMAYLGKGDVGAAVSLLDGYLSDDIPARTLGQRMMWCVRAEAALAEGDARMALRITDRLLEASANLMGGNLPARVGRIRAEALISLARETEEPEGKEPLWHEAEELLRKVCQELQDKGYRSRLWRIYRALAQLYYDQGRRSEAEREQTAMRDVINDLTRNISDPHLGRELLRQAQAVGVGSGQ